MNIKEIEQKLIACIQSNVSQSGEEIPQITRNTAPLSGIAGFDSLRTLEVLVELEEILECELPPEKIFSGPRPEDKTISFMAKAIKKLKEEQQS